MYYSFANRRMFNKYCRKENSVMKITVKVVKPASEQKNVLCCTCGIIS